MRGLVRSWLGEMPYLDAEVVQIECREKILAGKGQECIFGASHPPVFVRGVRTPPAEHMRAEIAVSGIPLIRSKRGGLLTYHGPGQLMIYCIIDTRRRGLSIPAFVCQLEQAVITWIQSLGISAHRVDGAPGVWVGERKIASVGLHFKRWVSMYGLAINLTPDPVPNSLIRPCGFDPSIYVSLSELLAQPPAIMAAWEGMANEITRRFGMNSVDSKCSSG